MIVSLANSLRFIENNGLDPSLNNTLFKDEEFTNIPAKCFNQVFMDGQDLIIQIKAGLTETVTLTRYNLSSFATISATTTTTYTNYKIIDYTITLATSDKFYLIATSSSGNSWTSETVEVVERGDLLKVEWYNYDPRLVFEFDYSNDEVNEIYLDANLLDYTPGGSTSIYDNQNEKVKIKQSVFRILTLQTNPIPRYLAEKVQLAMAHDRFAVNDITYTVEDIIKIEPVGKSNMVQLTADLTQTTVLGINSDDVGFDCDTINPDDMIINLQQLNGSGQFQFTATAGYSINQLILRYQDGTGVTVKIGTTVGGEEILREWTVSESGQDTLDREIALSRDSDTTIYVEVSGSNALVDVNIQTIKYTA